MSYTQITEDIYQLHQRFEASLEENIHSRLQDIRESDIQEVHIALQAINDIQEAIDADVVISYCKDGKAIFTQDLFSFLARSAEKEYTSIDKAFSHSVYRASEVFSDAELGNFWDYEEMVLTYDKPLGKAYVDVGGSGIDFPVNEINESQVTELLEQQKVRDATRRKYSPVIDRDEAAIESLLVERRDWLSEQLTAITVHIETTQENLPKSEQ